MREPELAVVIPALDEAVALPALLAQLRAQRDVALEVVVADGGSRDATATLAAAADVTVVATPRGRGAQMNAGAAATRAPVLLFLHADSRLDHPRQLREALDALGDAGPDCAGHWPLRFARESSGRDFFYRWLEAKTALNRAGTVNGDQGLLLPRGLFEVLGRFDESLPFLEDARIAARIERQARWLLLPGRLTTSARRFEREGALRRYTLMALIMGLHAARCDAFFRRAPGVYAAQTDTAALRLGPWLALTARVLRESGPRGAIRTLLDAGRYTRRNSWQPFFWIDVAAGRAQHPRALAFHDRRVAPLLDHRAADALAAVLIAAWFLGALRLWCALFERGAPARYAVLPDSRA